MKGKFGRDFLTGLTALGGVAGLVAMLALFGELRDVGQKFYSFTLRLDSAGGLTNTSHVMLNGVRVGTIAAVTNAPDPTQGVELQLRVKEATKIPASFDVFIDRSLVGDANLDLVVKPAAAPEINFVHADDVVQRKAVGLFDRIASSVRDPLERITKTAENIDRLAGTYDQVGKHLEDLLAPRTPAQVGEGAAPNVRTVIARADSTLSEANKWFGDDQLRGDVRGIATKASDVLDQASDTAKSLKSAAAALDKQIATTGPKIDAAADQAGTTLRRIDDAASEVAKLTTAINSGEGTLGQLSTNPDLYNAVRDAAKRLERALAEFQLMVEKYKAEGIPLKL